MPIESLSLRTPPSQYNLMENAQVSQLRLWSQSLIAIYRSLVPSLNKHSRQRASAE